MTDHSSRPSAAVALALLLLAAAASAQAQAPAPAQSRGELLYATHCNFCHTTQVHWRDNRAATDWTTLRAQVYRWQLAESLAWNETTVVEVANYLNDTIYRFERAPESRSLRPREGVNEPTALLGTPAQVWTARESTSRHGRRETPVP